MIKRRALANLHYSGWRKSICRKPMKIYDIFLCKIKTRVYRQQTEENGQEHFSINEFWITQALACCFFAPRVAPKQEEQNRPQRTIVWYVKLVQRKITCQDGHNICLRHQTSALLTNLLQATYIVTNFIKRRISVFFIL